MQRQSSIKIRKLYQELRRTHGHPRGQWQLWCKRRKTSLEEEEVIIGAILTQRTSWRNVQQVCAALHQAACLSLQSIGNLGRRRPSTLTQMIRSCGFYKTKARYLTSTANFFVSAGGVRRVRRRPLMTLRSQLLALPGIGPETADSILLYAFGKPVFVVDEYTRRLAVVRGFANARASYDELQQFFVRALPRSFRLYQDFHALVVIDGQAGRLTRPRKTMYR